MYSWNRVEWTKKYAETEIETETEITYSQMVTKKN